MTALNAMARAPLDVTATGGQDGGRAGHHHACTIRPRTSLSSSGPNCCPSALADEILPIEYDDNYVTVFPGETVELHGVVPTDHTVANWVRVGGYNTPPVVVPIE